MLKGLMGIFSLLILIILMITAVRFMSRRMKRALKPQRSSIAFVAEVDPRTAAPQLLNQILLMLPGENNEVLSRLSILTNDGGNARIDVLLICPTGLYLFNSKNLSGAVTGSAADPLWYVLQEDGTRKAIKNPVEENRNSIQALRTRYPEIKEEWIRDYVVFSNRCGIYALQPEMEGTVILSRKALFEKLRSQIAGLPEVLTPERVQYFYSRLKLYTEGERAVSGISQKKGAGYGYPLKSETEIHEIKPPDLTRFSPEDQRLKEKLTAFAREQSRKARIVAAEVLDKDQIERLINMKPQNLIELETVLGMDEKRCEAYGEAIVKIIRQHCDEITSEL